MGRLRRPRRRPAPRCLERKARPKAGIHTTPWQRRKPMKNPILSMNSFRFLTACTLSALLCSCAGTSVKKTWKSPDYHAQSGIKLAVLTVADRGMLRKGFENRLVAELGRQGASAIVT